MKKPLLAAFVAAGILPLLGGCDDSPKERHGEPASSAEAKKGFETQDPAAHWTLKETFNVGNGVYVRSLAVEPARDALWVGTSTGVLEVGLKDRGMRNTFTRDDGLANGYVFGIGVDSQGYKWFGTNGGGVSRYRDGEWRTFFPKDGLADYWVYSFAETEDGKLWVGTWDGANRVNLETLHFTTFKKELINEWVYGLEVDSQGRVWFGTEGGISMLDDGKWSHWTHEDGLGAPNKGDLPPSQNTGLGTRSRHDLNERVKGKETYNPNYVFGLHTGPKGRIWAGTWGGGVARFDGNEWTNFTEEDGLAGNIVYSVEKGPDGSLWFGTNEGLTRFDGSQWQSFRTEDGLPGPDVYAIAADGQGNVWAGTKGGVVRLGIQNRKKSEEKGAR